MQGARCHPAVAVTSSCNIAAGPLRWAHCRRVLAACKHATPRRFTPADELFGPACDGAAADACFGGMARQATAIKAAKAAAQRRGADALVLHAGDQFSGTVWDYGARAGRAGRMWHALGGLEGCTHLQRLVRASDVLLRLPSAPSLHEAGRAGRAAAAGGAGRASLCGRQVRLCGWVGGGRWGEGLRR